MAALAALAMTSGLAGAEPLSPPGAEPLSPPASPLRQALEDAWWTGPMLANTAATAPPGHFLVEPYFYDVTGEGRFDSRGARRSTARANGFGSQSYVVYGLADKLAVGLIPNVGYNTVSGGPSSSHAGLGDVSVLAQVGLTQFHPGRWLPTTAVNVQETFPNGKYDRLGDRPTDGFGSGAYTTTLSLYSQTYFWLPNGRILRMRLNVSQAFSSRVNIQDVSVYGTAPGFRGSAAPVSSFFVDASWEYSLTRSWVLASDVMVRRTGNTRVTGTAALGPDGMPIPPSTSMDLGSSEAFIVAPALEYSWRPDLGVLLGVRVIAAGRNTAATVTPALAINYVH